MLRFNTPGEWMQHAIRIVLLGCGGTGAEVLGGLARLHHALRATGHPSGLHVVAVDGDKVSPSNIGRQPFSRADVGLFKSIVLVNRYNIHFGLRWEARPQYLDSFNTLADANFDILITCVDKASVRAEIAKACRDVAHHRNSLWLDHGNSAQEAQVVLGCLTALEPDNGCVRLPHVYDLYPDLDLVDDHAEPSCSVAEALQRQDLMINRITADCGLQLLTQLLRHGHLERHGAFIDIKRLGIQPLRIDPGVWRQMGYQTAAASGAREAA